MNYLEYMEKAHEVLKSQYGNDIVRMVKAQEYIHIVANSLINLDMLAKLNEKTEQTQVIDYSAQINEGIENIIKAVTRVEEKAPAPTKKK